jgi:very-long-chain (3R)-3-hydroxyacyl-CoA dehydratase
MAAGDDGSAVRRLYLSVYNWVSFFGWLVDSKIRQFQVIEVSLGLDARWPDSHVLGSEFCRLQVLYHVTLALLGSGHQAVYAAVKLPLLFSQTAALAEVN